MSEHDMDLRATAEDLAADAARLEEIEKTKARAGIDDTNAIALADEALTLARRMVGKTAAERDLAVEAARDHGDTSSR